MLTVESRKFCCCLPVRLGVFVLALLCMAGGSIVATVGWMSVSQLQQHPVELMDEIALYIHASIFTLLGVLGIFGFVGSLVKSRVMVISFSVGIAIHLGLSIGSGIFTIYSVFKEAPQAAIDTCMDGKTDAETLQMCKTGMNIVKGAMVAIYVIAWLIELYAYFIVERYSTQLEEEEIARLTPILPQSVNQGPVYIGYPQRFSYSQYSRRSYQEPRRPSYDKQEMSQDPQYNGQYQHDPRHDTDYQPQQQQQRPHSEYAFNLPQQAYGVNRGKDAGNA